MRGVLRAGRISGMGYTTTFEGHVTVTPPLNPAAVAYLTAFATTRRMDRANGPYYVAGTDAYGQGRDADIRDYNAPPPGQPGLWCQWTPTVDGAWIEWDGGEKFYDSEEWMRYLIDHFLKAGGRAQEEPGFEEFTFDHVLSGTIHAQGEEVGDVWDLRVVDNVVTRVAWGPLNV